MPGCELLELVLCGRELPLVVESELRGALFLGGELSLPTGLELAVFLLLERRPRSALDHLLGRHPSRGGGTRRALDLRTSPSQKS